MCSSDAPDTGAMERASTAATQAMVDLGREQMVESRRQYDEIFPIVQEISQLQTDVMKQSMEQGKEYYDYMKETYRPLESEIAADVGQYNQEAEYQRLAGEAGADVERQAAIQKGITAREMSSMGINPASGKYQSVAKQTGLKTAGLKAGAMTKARSTARDTGFAKKLAVLGLGRNLPGQSLSALQTATGAGTTSANIIQQPGRTLTTGLKSGAGTIAQGHQMGISGRQAILNAQRSSGIDTGELMTGVGSLATGLAALDVI